VSAPEIPLTFSGDKTYLKLKIDYSSEHFGFSYLLFSFSIMLMQYPGLHAQAAPAPVAPIDRVSGNVLILHLWAKKKGLLSP
jgi:hypothetical protein